MWPETKCPCGKQGVRVASKVSVVPETRCPWCRKQAVRGAGNNVSVVPEARCPWCRKQGVRGD